MPQIFEPVTLGTLTLPNRLVRSATWEGLADGEGRVNEALLSIYRRLAEGGVGLIISSYLYVHLGGRQHATQIGAHRDARVEDLARLAGAVHGAGGRLVGQIVHCGGQATQESCAGRRPVAPSAVNSPGYPRVPRELSTEEVRQVVSQFAAAAGRVKAAGFDGVQLHGAHGYLLSQFLSPLRNRRSDEFGGSIENRARFALEVHDAVRAAVGPGYPVMIKLNGHDFLRGSTTEEDSCYLAAELGKRGVAAIEVSGGTPGSGKLGAARAKLDGPQHEAYFLPQARAIRAAAPGVPLMLVGGVRSPERMEAILAEGVVDCFALARPLIREPDLPGRWRSGDRAPAGCISCNKCFRPAHRGEGIRCVELDAGA